MTKLLSIAVLFTYLSILLTQESVDTNVLLDAQSAQRLHDMQHYIVRPDTPPMVVMNYIATLAGRSSVAQYHIDAEVSYSEAVRVAAQAISMGIVPWRVMIDSMTAAFSKKSLEDILRDVMMKCEVMSYERQYRTADIRILRTAERSLMDDIRKLGQEVMDLIAQRKTEEEQRRTMMAQQYLERIKQEQAAAEERAISQYARRAILETLYQEEISIETAESRAHEPR